MKTYQSEGGVVELQIPGAGVTKDVPVQIGSLVVIPTVTAAYAANTRFNGLVKGIVSGLTKVASQAWSEGASIYWDAALTKVSSHSGDNKWIGIALEAVAGGASDVLSGEILFNGMLTQADETT